MKKDRMGLALLLALLLALAAGCAGKGTSPAGGEYALTLLHSNDSHSVYGGTTADGMLCYAPLCQGGKGGSVRMQRAVRAIRHSTPDALFFDAGDVFQGSLYWVAHKEVMPADLLNFMGYQAIIPGNHEFDAGCGPFLNQVRSLKTPVLAANLSFSPLPEGPEGAEGPEDPDQPRPWLVLERAGRKIGVVGIVNPHTQNLSSPCSEAHFAEAESSLRAAVQELEKQGVNIIIALTHIGLENDRRLARAVDGVDILVGGHSHSLLSNSLPEAEGPYPLVELSPAGKPVLIATASTGMRYLGRLDARFDGAGIPLSWQGEPIALDDAALAVLNAPAADPDLVRRIEEYSEPVRHMMRSPLGRIAAAGREGKALEEQNVRQCRQGECLTGNIVADALLAQAFSDAEAVILNSGALRYSLPGGTVTAGDVLATLPFQNTPMLADMPGQVLLHVLEHGVRAYGEGQGAFLQTSGLRYSFDPGRAPGTRITRAEIRNRQGAWRPVRRDASYRIATVDYLAAGGDGFAMLRPMQWRESPMLMNDALRLHLQKNSPLTPKLEGRIQRAR